jgi:SAM-dependent methyltransferase
MSALKGARTMYTPDILIAKWLGQNADSTTKIVDVGCGDGRLIKSLVGQGYANAVGTDILFHEKDPHGAAEELRSRFPFVLTEGRLPFPDGSVDVVLSNQVFEHVSDKRAFLSEILRVLRRGGIALLVFPTSEAIVEHHVKLPYFHLADLRKAWVRAFYMTLVWVGLGAYGDFRDRKKWIRKMFKTYSLGHHYVFRKDALELAATEEAEIQVLDAKYLDALRTKYPLLAVAAKWTGGSRILLRQIGMAMTLRKR